MTNNSKSGWSTKKFT